MTTVLLRALPAVRSVAHGTRTPQARAAAALTVTLV